ncbi:biotin carboxylase N-terminal domain-containing protein [Sphingomonas sp. Ant20]|uniref:acetyl/propionyl/methylcrotonyl-CoA carboxylase subunit alpha n=1 Tax=Sphingomonas sp. Ant20 TaxID=104605 RepID=UPI00053729A3|nr:biotin carboxylase N-terminal domain-containing protein [Sphingomonas sp. Ant20]KHA65184.1 methylcrotonoyl-CoA carboxylase [Sphingomonas sp. Ant20]
MLSSVLIANRGEIACRIIRTARRLRIRTVSVYSDADRDALHVRQADDAVHIGGSQVRESYLRGDRIIEAALSSGAEAIHPGYGFLSENAEFAEQVVDAGLIWIGPRPESIRAMGLKDAAKARMIAANVPVTPGYLGAVQDATRLRFEAEAIGFPVLIKAVAGGGGKGMRRVDDPGSFDELLDSCKREARSSFGDDRVLIEKYILSPRHIEVQVFGDSHGNVVHLFERDCSLQRRHQKVIEEAPAPGMDEATRAAVCAAAVKAAEAVAYVGAGTIEFIADASEGLRADRIWFMEMNTRLQVEHPVTEAITGQDLVEWQLRVASGEPLPLRQDELAISGWAMEGRLYAENPSNGFLPSIGKLEHLELPEGVRVDTGVVQGAEVTPFYDPMIAKLIAWAPSRAEAAAKLAAAAASSRVWPVRTNAAFLRAAALHGEFVDGRIDTGFIERHLTELVPDIDPPMKVLQAAAAAILPSGRAGAWGGMSGFRMNSATETRVQVEFSGSTYLVEPRPSADVHIEDSLAFDGGQAWHFTPPRSDSFVQGAGVSDGALLSPMPGRVIGVLVASGEVVAKGQRLIVLEAMKMEQTLTAPFDGTVGELRAVEGMQVVEGALLAQIREKE